MYYLSSDESAMNERLRAAFVPTSEQSLLIKILLMPLGKKSDSMPKI